MSSLLSKSSRRIVFVSRQLGGEAVRSAQAVRRLDDVVLFGISEPVSNSAVTSIFSDLIFVKDVHSADQLIAAARTISNKHGSLEQIVTVQETLLEPVARANEALGLKAMSVSQVMSALDKSRLKSVFEHVGISTPRSIVLRSNNDARRFAASVGLPIVLKPLTGSGGLATWCIRTVDQLELALELMQPSAGARVLAEEYVQGQELCIDTITIHNEPQFYSLCLYRPSILEALENPNIQWSCVMPRDITTDKYRDFIEQGLVAVRALNVGNAMTHMEGFLLAGGGHCFTDATLRPAGARIAPMLAFAYDIDPYRAWARATVDGCFDRPWERNYAVGTIFLRGEGSGTVEQVSGVETVQRELTALITAASWPKVGATKSATYTGDGYVTLRHDDTRTVESALDYISQKVRISYSQMEPDGSGITDQWAERLQHFDKQLNKPAWDTDALPV